MRAKAGDLFALRVRFEKVKRQLKEANDRKNTVKRDNPMLYGLFEYHAGGGDGEYPEELHVIFEMASFMGQSHWDCIYRGLVGRAIGQCSDGV
jgi:hypothetical protein